MKYVMLLALAIAGCATPCEGASATGCPSECYGGNKGGYTKGTATPSTGTVTPITGTANPSTATDSGVTENDPGVGGAESWGPLQCSCSSVFSACDGIAEPLCASCCENQARAAAGDSFIGSIRAPVGLNCSGCEPTTTGGCFSTDSRLNGSLLTRRITEKGWRIRHATSRLTGIMLCHREADDILCATEGHIVRVKGSKDLLTMREACDGPLLGACTQRLGYVRSYWSGNPRAEVCGQVLCVTQLAAGWASSLVMSAGVNNLAARVIWQVVSITAYW
jgi:hypothetical protein